MRLKSVMLYDPQCRIFRIGRIVWRRGEGPGRGAPANYDASLSLALCPPWRLRFHREYGGWLISILGIRVHRNTSYGGCLI